MPTLERALQIAVKSHAGQKDKNSAAYIFHPIRVMMRCTSADAKIAALLHDVVEDTPVTFEELEAEGFSADVLSALRLLTHAKEVPYDDYIQSLTVNRIAIEVKIADLEDNMDIRRLQEVDDKATARFRKYLAAYRFLISSSSAIVQQ
jgi:(p)ppGpp synthase/HD superfamily hydrolase